MRGRRAGCAALLSVAVMGSAWWLLERPLRALPEASGDLVAAAGLRQAPPPVGLPSLPDVATGPWMAAAAARQGAVAAGHFEVCGIGAVPAEWHAPDPGSGWMVRALPLAVGRGAHQTALNELLDVLRRSPQPRERAVALMLERGPAQADALEALSAASHDVVLAHWAFAACQVDRGRPPGACATRARRWAQLEPDNGVAWLAVMEAERGTEQAVMPSLALATRFDEHYGEAVRVAAAALKSSWALHIRTQLLADVLGAESQRVPWYQALTQHCATDRLDDVDRRQRCESMVELLTGRSGTLLSRAMGLRLAERLDWPPARLASLRAERARIHQDMRLDAIRTDRETQPYGCPALEKTWRHLQGLAGAGEWASLTASRP